MSFLKQMNTTSPQTTMLYTHSWFTSKEYNLNYEDSNYKHLTVSKASMNYAKSENFPLDMIEATPRVEKKFDHQFLAFTLISALASGVFLTFSASMNSAIISLLGGLFLLTTIGSAYIALQNKVRSYTYFYTGSDTPMFTLTSKKSDEEKVDMFIKNLSQSIKHSTTQSNEDTNSDTQLRVSNQTASNEEQEYLAYTYHLDFLFASGLIDNESYLKVGHNISERVFGSTQTETVSEPSNNSNIINFPG